MNNKYEEIETKCPSCSKEWPVMHHFIKNGQNPLVKCNTCGFIHPIKVEATKESTIKAIISSGETTFSLNTVLDSSESIRLNDEIIIDDEASQEAYLVLITSIESDGKRVKESQVENIETIWCRDIGEVDVKFSIHSGTETIPLTKRVLGDFEFTVGSQDKIGGMFFQITHIKIRDGKLLSRKGQIAEAKHIKRIFAKKISRNWGEATSWTRVKNNMN
ncbi:HVO_0476 family zinc finger protein [Methanosalsum natronophilum]|uniref:Uncharacterized protein n=1 Tax=Methanosalsum natronophilum TaxID=768733 RepID=A0A424YZ62_9EURY|nr:HVO_0476 family zinc finger protein [Methanosalsum natronophilum]MCS3924010.1 putative Zn finger protein [Methanosalsum natronophilum]RQD86581.1 MAG: hypothetical protein D5R95_03815 [Methanosalsum natronophilum]